MGSITLTTANAPGIIGPGVPVKEKGIVIWDDTTGTIVADSGIRHYGSSATDPLSIVGPSEGDIYHNTVLGMPMRFDRNRMKWLSAETCVITFNGRSILPGTFYLVGERTMSITNGRPAEWDGTIVSISLTRSDFDSVGYQVLASGSVITQTPSAAIATTDTTLNGDFSQGDILSIRNRLGGNTTSNTIGFVRLKWRAT